MGTTTMVPQEYAAKLLASMRSCGFSVRRSDDGAEILIRPFEMLNEAQKKTLKQTKPLLLEALYQEELAEAAEMEARASVAGTGERIAVVGTRDYKDPAAVREFVRSLPPCAVIVSGAGGVVDCTAAAEGRRLGLVVDEYPADWNGPKGLGAGPMRNTDIVAACDRVVAFWDGKSKGTRDTIDKAIKAGKPVLIVYPGQTVAGLEALAELAPDAPTGANAQSAYNITSAPAAEPACNPLPPVVFLPAGTTVEPGALVWTLEQLGNDKEVCHVRVGLPCGKSVLGVGRDRHDAQGALDNLIADLDGCDLAGEEERGIREVPEVAARLAERAAAEGKGAEG